MRVYIGCNTSLEMVFHCLSLFFSGASLECFDVMDTSSRIYGNSLPILPYSIFPWATTTLSTLKSEHPVPKPRSPEFGQDDAVDEEVEDTQPEAPDEALIEV